MTFTLMAVAALVAGIIARMDYEAIKSLNLFGRL